MREVAVLAVPPALQGSGFPGFVTDSSYEKLVWQMITSGVDFVFEEAGGCGLSIARKFTDSLLGPDHYIDVDPQPAERAEFSRPVDSGGWSLVDPFDSKTIFEWSILDDQRRREELWVWRIQEKNFKKGLLICGVAHNLSIAFRLQFAGIGVSKVCSYIPHNKLCTRAHLER